MALILVGTVHRDPGGFRKLCRLLEKEDPDWMTVEFSPYGRRFRARKGRQLRLLLRKNLRRVQEREGKILKEILSHGSIVGIFSLLSLPYEWRAGASFAARKGIPFREIDRSIFSRERLSHTRELISVENLRALVRLPSSDLQEEVASQYGRARFLFSNPPSFWRRKGEMKEREIHLAEKIRSICRKKRDSKVLHIGGWEHLVEVPDGRSLYGLLKDLDPQRVLLESSVKNPNVFKQPSAGEEDLWGETLFFHKFCGKGVEKFRDRGDNIPELHTFIKTA